MKTKLLEIINHYGLENQQRKFQEEVFELQRAIFQYEYYEVSNTDNIMEEMADICVLLMQLCNYFKIKPYSMSKIMDFKIDRQIERINNETNN